MAEVLKRKKDNILWLLPRLEFLEIFLSLSNTPGQHFEISDDQFLPNPFLFTS
jgi:hypothetical protein